MKCPVCINVCDCIRTPRRGGVNMYLKEIMSLESKLKIAVEFAEYARDYGNFHTHEAALKLLEKLKQQAGDEGG